MLLESNQELQCKWTDILSLLPSDMLSPITGRIFNKGGLPMGPNEELAKVLGHTEN